MSGSRAGTGVPWANTAQTCSPRVEQDLEGGCKVVVLMGGLVIVYERQLIHGGDQEAVVDA